MIPNDLIKAIKDNNCIFFLGAGMSVTSGIPITKDIKDELYNKYKGDYETIQPEDTLTKIASKAGGAIESIKDDLSNMLISQSNNIPTEYRLLTLLAKKCILCTAWNCAFCHAELCEESVNIKYLYPDPSLSFRMTMLWGRNAQIHPK